MRHRFGRHHRQGGGGPKDEEARVRLRQLQGKAQRAELLEPLDLGAGCVEAGLARSGAEVIEPDDRTVEHEPGLAVDVGVGVALERIQHVVDRDFTALAAGEAGVVVEAHAGPQLEGVGELVGRHIGHPRQQVGLQLERAFEVRDLHQFAVDEVGDVARRPVLHTRRVERLELRSAGDVQDLLLLCQSRNGGQGH
jgi:hypothetical protein